MLVCYILLRNITMRKLTFMVLMVLSGSVAADVVPFDNDNYVEPEIAAVI